MGWALGIGLPAIVVMMFTVSSKNVAVANPTILASGIRIFLGALLLFASFHRWQRRPKTEEEIFMPKWMQVIDSISPWKALVVGFLFADVTNPKNMALTVAACISITNGSASVIFTAALLTAFVIISSAGVAVPVIIYLAGGEQAKLTLDAWKVWLMRNNNAVMAILFLVFGLLLLSKGITDLVAL
jgi:cytochrome c biogenesis protein CcdA